VQPGDLVKVTRASIGVPINTLGLILAAHEGLNDYMVYDIQLCSTKRRRIIRLSQDLEVISGIS
jgi:hypothetical protein